MSAAEQMDALLEGLSAEDLDMDFDPTEDDPKDDAFLDRDVDVGFDDCAPSFVPAGPNQGTPFLGFVTGRNSIIPAPSSEAFAKVRKIFDEDPVLAEVASTLPMGEPPYKRQKLDGETSASVLMPPPRSSGFATAGGKAPPAISPSAQAATVNLFSTPAPASKAASTPSPLPISGSGFATANGRAPPPISPAAASTSRMLFREAEPLPSGSPGSRSGFATATGRTPLPISAAAASASRDLFQQVDTPSAAPPTQRSSGFATAGEDAPPPISRAAAASADSLFSQPDQDDFYNAEIPPSAAGTFSLGFSTGAGKAVAPPSSAARARAVAMFEDPDPASAQQTSTPITAPIPFAPPRSTNPSAGARPAHQPMGRDRVGVVMSDQISRPSQGAVSPRPFNSPLASTQFRRLANMPTSSGLASGSGRVAAPPSQAARDRVGAIFTDDQNSRPPQSAPSSSFVTPRPPTQSRQSATGAVFRTPLRTTTNTSSQPFEFAPSNLTGSPAPRKLKPVEIGTPMLRRRVGLGMTPSRLGKGKGTGFSAPSRVGAATEPLLPAEPISLPPAPIIEPVFDLTKPSGRQTYREAYLKPQYHTVSELMEHGLPNEIFVMELRLAKAFRFVGDDDADLGPDEALSELKAAGCPLATPAWVLNHWSMILWKLAGVIQAQYTLFDQLWSWEVVIFQLLYRYEREYGRAERPIVRRIHEHDSSPSLPLVLCVSAIVRPPSPILEEGDKEEPVRPFLELTDGWYRISAQVDECLAKAIAKGSIRVGRKLAITGAKLESSSEGVDPLESLDKTLLTIAGNSTKLASWDAKLGRQNEPFVSGLSSLSVDGGIVSLMDVVIDKLFPLAYSSAERGNREEPWGEEEERQRQDAWTEKYAAESTKLQREMRKQLEMIEDVVTALCSAAEGVEGGGGDPPDNVDQIFDSLLETKSIDARLRTMASPTLIHVAQYGRSYHERESANSHLEVEAELQVLCPPRQVRDFRIVRVHDARRGYKPACRAGMLNVWDAKALGEGALVEGKRYMVANVMPGRSGDWRPPGTRQDGTRAEIYLHTRKDTRWQSIE